MNEDLMKELSQLQDELMKLQPAIKQIERTSQSAELIERKIPKVTKRLDSIKEEALSISKDIKNSVSTFEEISSDVKGKLDHINNKITSTLEKFNENAEKQKAKWDKKFQNELDRTSTSIIEAEATLKKTDESYSEKVATLVKEVENKAKEIFEIYKVLDDIKADQNQYSGFMEEAEKVLQEKLEVVHLRMNEDLDSSIKNRIANMEESSKILLKETSANATKILNDAKTELEKKETGLVHLNSLYESKVNTLIDKIDSRSSEITRIYDELENIRETNNKYTSRLEITDQNGKDIIEKVKKEAAAIKTSLKSTEVIARLEKLVEKVERLENHAHKHNFGGIPL